MMQNRHLQKAHNQLTGGLNRAQSTALKITTLNIYRLAITKLVKL
jgi:hypothetical protein